MTMSSNPPKGHEWIVQSTPEEASLLLDVLLIHFERREDLTDVDRARVRIAKQAIDDMHSDYHRKRHEAMYLSHPDQRP